MIEHYVLYCDSKREVDSENSQSGKHGIDKIILVFDRSVAHL